MDRWYTLKSLSASTQSPFVSCFFGVYVDVWVAMPRGGSRAPLARRGPENLTSKRTRIIGDNVGVARAP